MKYRVSIEHDGLDCDGPITHGVDEHVMTHEELTSHLGMFLLRHGEVHVEKGTHGLFMIFSHAHDEGFSRTRVDIVEVDDDYADDDLVAGYSLTTGEPVYR